MMYTGQSEIKLYVYIAEECDPKKCTANKLVRFGLVKPIYKIRDLPRNCIILNPLAEEELTLKDRELALRHGIIAIDCSWKNVQAFFSRVRIRGFHRKLPRLLAANPINFGVPHILSTAEALAASLYILGFKNQAKRLLSIFKWGPHFFELNKGVLSSIH